MVKTPYATGCYVGGRTGYRRIGVVFCKFTTLADTPGSPGALRFRTGPDSRVCPARVSCRAVHLWHYFAKCGRLFLPLLASSFPGLLEDLEKVVKGFFHVRL